MAPHSYKSLDVDDGDASNAVRNCSTIAELHAVLPLSFRPALSEYLTKVYRIATKLGNVGNQIAQYEKHTTNGTFPPFIANTIKVPKIQFSNEYDSSPNGLTCSKTLTEVVTTARTGYLAEALKRKKEEQTLLQQNLAFKADVWQKDVEETASRVAASLGATFVNNGGKWSWSGASVPESMKQEAEKLWKHGNVYHVKAIGIARAISDKQLLQRMRNVSLREQASTDKMDVDSKDSSVQATMEDMLKKFEQKLASGAITVKMKPTNRPKGGNKKGPSPKGGKNGGRINKSPPKKKQPQRRRN